jgi:hypothetical protein
MLGNVVHVMQNAFVDMRYIVVVMVAWLICICTVLCELGLLENSRFVAFGPRASLQFMHMNIDTGYKYGMLVLLIILHTFITECIGDSLGPHVLNVLQDPRTRQLPHPPKLYYAITTVWTMYCAVSQLIVIFLVLAQLDLLLVRLISELLATAMTTTLYLHGKQYIPHPYSNVASSNASQQEMKTPLGDT